MTEDTGKSLSTSQQEEYNSNTSTISMSKKEKKRMDSPLPNSHAHSHTLDTIPTTTTTAADPDPDSSSPCLLASSQCRDPVSRPAYRLSVKLIDTYKYINKVYYEAKAKRLREQQQQAQAQQHQHQHSQQQQAATREGVYNDGYDDQNYDYIIHGDEIFAERYILKHRIGRGSFGQVVCAYDRQSQNDVAIKIIKSKNAFTVQARTEIHLLNLVKEKDPDDDQNIVHMIDTFIYRNHQCLVFEMLSYNLYELLKNTRFKGVSLGLVRKFAKQILNGLNFLTRPDVDIIHCDLKPENILLRHPKRSAIKIIDFGSSCLSTKKTYTYIQSRFYRSPEVLLGLPYDQKIDMWSLGCVLVEMHTGEPLFGGLDQLDQLNRIVSIFGMVPPEMVAASPAETRAIFFDKIEVDQAVADESRCVTVVDSVTNLATRYLLKSRKDPREYKKKTLEEIVGVYTGGPYGRRKGEAGHSEEAYLTFVDFIKKLLVYIPSKRITPAEALQQLYITQPIETTTSNPALSLRHPSAAPTTESTGHEPTQHNEEDTQHQNNQQGNELVPNSVKTYSGGRGRSKSEPDLSYNGYQQSQSIAKYHKRLDAAAHRNNSNNNNDPLPGSNYNSSSGSTNSKPRKDTDGRIGEGVRKAEEETNANVV